VPGSNIHARTQPLTRPSSGRRTTAFSAGSGAVALIWIGVGDDGSDKGGIWANGLGPLDQPLQGSFQVVLI
jgi:hypothetical protein